MNKKSSVQNSYVETNEHERHGTVHNYEHSDTYTCDTNTIEARIDDNTSHSIDTPQRILTPANMVTLIRICLVPVFVTALLSPWPALLGVTIITQDIQRIIATVIFIIISATDWLDGYLARSRNEVTDFGKFIDPLADKILVASALLALIELGALPSWVVLIILAREFIVSGVRMLAATAGVVIAASYLGKFKTVFQMIAIVLFTIKDTHSEADMLLSPNEVLWIISWIVMTIALILTIVSMLDYIAKARHVIGLSSLNRRSFEQWLQARTKTISSVFDSTASRSTAPSRETTPLAPSSPTDQSGFSASRVAGIGVNSDNITHSEDAQGVGGMLSAAVDSGSADACAVDNCVCGEGVTSTSNSSAFQQSIPLQESASVQGLCTSQYHQNLCNERSQVLEQSSLEKMTPRTVSCDETENAASLQGDTSFLSVADRMMDATLYARELITCARAHGYTLGTAESLTGGMICEYLTSVPGSSSVVNGGLVCYTPLIKQNICHVGAQFSTEDAVVTTACVEEMARGAQKQLAATLSVAVSGIAGPGGALPHKPIGYVCVGLCKDQRCCSYTVQFSGSRFDVRIATTILALQLLHAACQLDDITHISVSQSGCVTYQQDK